MSSPLMENAAEHKEVKKFVAPGARRAPKMAPTTFHHTPPPQPQPSPPAEIDGSVAERNPHNNRFPESSDGKRRFVPRQTQAARYHGPQQPTEDGQPPHPVQPPPGRRAFHNQPQHPAKESEQEALTFSRPAPPLAVFHKLGRPYTFSAFRRPANVHEIESYEKSIKTIGRFDTAEGFWAFYSHMQRPGDLAGVNADYHLFVEGITPMWEHKANRLGGKISIRLKKGTVSQMWEDLLLALVGDQFDAAEAICGVVASVRFKDNERKRDMLSVWIRDERQVAARDRIAQQLRSVLQLGTADIDFKPHSTSMQDLQHPSASQDEGRAEDG